MSHLDDPVVFRVDNHHRKPRAAIYLSGQLLPGIDEDNIASTMAELDVFVREAVAVAMKAQEQGVARIQASREELTKQAEKIIKEARGMTTLLMKEGYIPAAPGD